MDQGLIKVKRRCCFGLYHMSGPEIEEFLLKELGNRTFWYGPERCLGYVGGKRAIPIIEEVLEQESSSARRKRLTFALRNIRGRLYAHGLLSGGEENRSGSPSPAPQE